MGTLGGGQGGIWGRGGHCLGLRYFGQQWGHWGGLRSWGVGGHCLGLLFQDSNEGGDNTGQVYTYMDNAVKKSEQERQSTVVYMT